MLNGQELTLLVGKNQHLSSYFRGIYSLDRLPTDSRHPPLCFIVNTDTANLPGTHWLAVLVQDDQQGEVFDSFGQPTPPRLQLWMNKHCLRGWTANKLFIQGPLSSVCGAYCLYYLYHRLVVKHSPADIIQKQLLARKGVDSFILQRIKAYFK